jgi:hypothetical protein
MVEGIIGRFVAPKGLENLAQGLTWYLFSVDSYGPKGQENLAQGLPWVSQKNVFSPEGAPGRECLKARLCLNRNFPDRARSRARFLKASIEWFALFLGIKSSTRTRTRTRTRPIWGKPWAKFSWPSGPQRS